MSSRLLGNDSYTNWVTSPYGQRNSGFHHGIDIVGRYGESNLTDNITAHSDGTVVQIQTGKVNDTKATGLNSYGNFVKIKHSNGYFTLYAHLKRVDVTTGQVVKKGTVIGYMGNTGKSYGAHLHFEVRNEKDVRIDPTKYLTSDLPTVVSASPAPLSDYEIFLRDMRKALGLSAAATPKQIWSKTPKLYNNNKYNKVTVVLQTYLIALGISCGSKKNNGYFGNDTEKAVKTYQTKYKTGTVDGYLSAKGKMWKSLLKV